MKKAFLSSLILVSLFLMGGHAAALCVKVPEANLRGGPGTKYEKTWQVFKYMPLRRLAKKGAWYKVKDVDGDLHWIYGRLVTGSFRCAVVKVDEANIRTGPGTKYAKTAMSPALRYYSYRVMKMKGDWVNVKDEYGNTAWIFRKLLWIQ
jgi:SH3-like domain-containing protein